FNIKLNTFIANFEEKKPSFEVVRTGGLTEIRVGSNNAFAAYAFFLKNFREELFAKSVHWHFPLESFLTELDSLVEFYVRVFQLIEYNCVKNEEKEILTKQLIEPLALFFKSVDSEFGEDYFQKSVERFKSDKTPDILWINYSATQAFDKMRYGEDTRADIYQEDYKPKSSSIAIDIETATPKIDDDNGSKELSIEHKTGQCPECKVRNGDLSEKKLFKCKFCEKWLCERHLPPRVCYFPNLKAPDRIKAVYLSEKDKEDGHPDPLYTENQSRPFFSRPITKPMAPSEIIKPTEPTPDVVIEKQPIQFGACPICKCTDSEVIEDYPDKANLKCWNCHREYYQEKNPPHQYSEPSEPKPVPERLKKQPMKKDDPIPPPPRMNKGSEKGSARKAVIAVSLIISVLAIILVFAALNNSGPQNFAPSPLPTLSPSAITTQPTVAPTLPPPTNIPTTEPTSALQSQEELVNYALALINSDRQSKGLQNVTLSSVNSGQKHAEEMLKNGYFSHWDMNGYKPYTRYTLAGGEGAVAENIAWQGLTGNIFGIDVKSALSDLEYSMMYEDAASNWGHRDNILDALHNKVSIGIAYDNHNVYLVQDFEDDYVSWSQLSVNSNQVTLSGNINSQQSSIQQISIFYDNPTPLTASQLSQSPYNGAYDPGTFVGLVLTENWQSQSGITITASNWSQNGNSFQISFSLAQAIAVNGKGVYTLYLQTGSSTADSLLTYSILIS
ncbi:MAG TPA: CAP domain-containing protein, partial [Candidatus Acidoferrales bacterium]|nr:CAP domain-containing protein [Candidatus Acidoferrales bacterium]